MGSTGSYRRRSTQWIKMVSEFVFPRKQVTSDVARHGVPALGCAHH